jgi:membrane associated rhomboid family serine protease
MKFYTLWLTGIIIVFFIFQSLSGGFTDALILNQESFSQPWRFVSAIFLHGSLSHLVYNLFALILFGLILESLVGSKKFLLLFFITGILANLISVNFYFASLGASGAIFGIIGALAVIRPMMTIWAFGLPMPMFVAAIIWAAGDIIQTFVPTNVGTIAHLSGIFFGVILGLFFRKKKGKKPETKKYF